MPRTKSRGRRNGRRRSNDHDDQAAILENIRNRRYIAFVRAIVGAARARNSSR